MEADSCLKNDYRRHPFYAFNAEPIHKNWLFSGSPRGAHASCMIYSLIRTAEANGLEPYQYLRYLLEQLVHLKDEDKEKIAKLVPHQIDPSVLG